MSNPAQHPATDLQQRHVAEHLRDIDGTSVSFATYRTASFLYDQVAASLPPTSRALLAELVRQARAAWYAAQGVSEPEQPVAPAPDLELPTMDCPTCGGSGDDGHGGFCEVDGCHSGQVANPDYVG